MNEPVHPPINVPPDAFRLGDLVHIALALLGTLWPASSGTPTEIDWEDGEPEAAFDSRA